MVYIPPDSDQHFSDSNHFATAGHQDNGCVLTQHEQQVNAEMPNYYNKCDRYASDVQDQATYTIPQFCEETNGRCKEWNQPAQSTAEPQEATYASDGYVIPVASKFQLNSPVSTSSYNLHSNNLLSICQCECENIISTCQSANNACAYLQPTQNYGTLCNPFVEPSQDFTQMDQFSFTAHPTVPFNDLLDVGFEQDISILHNDADPKHVTSNFKTITDFSTDSKDFSLLSTCDQEVSSQPWKNQAIHDTFQGNVYDSSMEIGGKIFNSAYTDTVSSVTSTQFLIKPSGTDKDSVISGEEVKEIYFNCGYTEQSNHDNERKEVNLTQIEPGKEVQSALKCDDVSGSEPTNRFESQETVTDSINPFQHIQDFFHQHLIPVAENEILSFDIQEITPSVTPVFPTSSYTKITNNLTVADESFLFQSESSLCDQDKVKHGKMAGTMQNLHEHSSFMNLTNIEKMGRVCQRALIYLKDDLTFGSLASLNNMAAKNCSNPAQEVSLIDGTRNVDIIPSTKHRRNVIALSISITLLFIAMGSVRNLQSSLNQEGGVGIISMAVSFVGYMLGSIFSSSIVQTFQPRKCIVISLIPNLIYVAANIYPTLWLMTIVSLIQGISLAILWNAMSTYITFLSRGQALKKNEDFEKVSNNFFGIFCLIYQSYHIIGNLIASVVLMPGSSTATLNLANLTFNNLTTNLSSQEDTLFEPSALLPMMFEVDSVSMIRKNASHLNVNHLNLCGAEFCNHFEIGGSGVTVSRNTKYMLFGIYMGCIVVSIGIAAFLLESLNPRLFHSTVSPAQKMKLQLISLAKFSIDSRFLLLLPILMYSIMQFGFISGEVTMAFVTCPLGIHMVGYTMICFGVTASICSYISGILCKYTGRMPQIVTAAALNLAVLVFMTQWQPSLSTVIPYFCVMGLWGVSDGIWNCQVNSLMGVVFRDKYEEAYAGLRVAQGLGVAILFSYSNLVCMAVKIYIIAAICVFALLCYLIMEGILRYRMTGRQILVKQTSV